MSNQELIEQLGHDALSVIHQAGKGGVFPGRARRETGQRALVGDGAVILVEFTVTVIGYQVPGDERTSLFASPDAGEDSDVRSAVDAIHERIMKLDIRS